MKSFVYNKSHYFIQHTLPGLFTLLIGLYCLIRLVMNGFNGVLLFVLVLCIYNVWNEFISCSNPSEFDVDDNNLTFRAYNHEHTYKISEITQFSMRMVAGNTTIYMNINKGGLLKGRYWIRVSEFKDEIEITDYFYDLDERVNPNSVVTKARRDGRKRLADKELIKQREQEYLDKKLAEKRAAKAQKKAQKAARM